MMTCGVVMLCAWMRLVASSNMDDNIVFRWPWRLSGAVLLAVMRDGACRYALKYCALVSDAANLGSCVMVFGISWLTTRLQGMQA